MPGTIGKAPPNYNKTPLPNLFLLTHLHLLRCWTHPLYSIFAREGLFVCLFATDSPQAARNIGDKLAESEKGQCVLPHLASTEG